jgi:dolichol-phosphate mannosyltransferase
MNVSVILPTYNERGNIVPLIHAIQQNLGAAGITHNVIVVDDNSPDGTAQAVQDAFDGDGLVDLYVRTEERGLASAIGYGIRRAKGDCVAIMDTDFNHDPALLPQMVKFLEYYDIIIGSRFTMGGGMEEKWRYLASFLFNFWVRLILRTQVQDNLCGFFTMRRDKLLSMDVDRIFQGYGDYFMHLLFQAWGQHYTILEVPAFYRVRQYGESKSRFLHMFWNYTMAAFRVRLGLR